MSTLFRGTFFASLFFKCLLAEHFVTLINQKKLLISMQKTSSPLFTSLDQTKNPGLLISDEKQSYTQSIFHVGLHGSYMKKKKGKKKEKLFCTGLQRRFQIPYMLLIENRFKCTKPVTAHSSYCVYRKCWKWERGQGDSGILILYVIVQVTKKNLLMSTGRIYWLDMFIKLLRAIVVTVPI